MIHLSCKIRVVLWGPLNRLNAVHKAPHVGKNGTFCVQNLDAFALCVQWIYLHRVELIL